MSWVSGPEKCNGTPCPVSSYCIWSGKLHHCLLTVCTKMSSCCFVSSSVYLSRSMKPDVEITDSGCYDARFKFNLLLRIATALCPNTRDYHCPLYSHNGHCHRERRQGFQSLIDPQRAPVCIDNTSAAEATSSSSGKPINTAYING